MLTRAMTPGKSEKVLRMEVNSWEQIFGDFRLGKAFVQRWDLNDKISSPGGFEDFKMDENFCTCEFFVPTGGTHMWGCSSYLWEMN